MKHKTENIFIGVIDALTHAIKILGILASIFCQSALYATGGVIGVIAIFAYPMFKQLSSEQLHGDFLANVTAYLHSLGYDFSSTQLAGMIFYVWATFAVLLACYFINNYFSASTSSRRQLLTLHRLNDLGVKNNG